MTAHCFVSKSGKQQECRRNFPTTAVDVNCRDKKKLVRFASNHAIETILTFTPFFLWIMEWFAEKLKTNEADFG